MCISNVLSACRRNVRTYTGRGREPHRRIRSRKRVFYISHNKTDRCGVRIQGDYYGRTTCLTSSFYFSRFSRGLRYDARGNVYRFPMYINSVLTAVILLPRTTQHRNASDSSLTGGGADGKTIIDGGRGMHKTETLNLIKTKKLF